MSRSWIATACAGTLAIWAAGALPSAVRADEGYSEDAVKAAFLYRFADYVQWPTEALASAQFIVAVLDDKGVATELSRLLPTHPIQDRVAQVQSLTSIRELHDAQVLYVGVTDRDEIRRIIAAVGARPILIVTAYEGALEAGSAVNFLLLDRRVRFEVSLDAAERARLKLGSELLSVAVRVQGRRPVGLEPDESGARRLWVVRR